MAIIVIQGIERTFDGILIFPSQMSYASKTLCQAQSNIWVGKTPVTIRE